MLGTAILSGCFSSNVQANNLLLSNDLSVENFQFEKLNDVQYATYHWQCQNCGRTWSTGRSDFRPPQGKCGNGNHVWHRY